MTTLAWETPLRAALICYMLTDAPRSDLGMLRGTREAVVRPLAERLGWDGTCPFRTVAAVIDRNYREAVVRALGLPPVIEGSPLQLMEVATANASASVEDLDTMGFLLAMSAGYYIEDTFGIPSPLRPEVPGYPDKTPKQVWDLMIAKGVFSEAPGPEKDFLRALKEELQVLDYGNLSQFRS